MRTLSMRTIGKARLACCALGMLFMMPGMVLAQSTFQAANAHIFPVGDDVAGAATLIRDEDSINVRLTMSGLDKKASYSVWFIIFNDACVGACDGPDIDAVRNAGGFLTGTDGTGYMVGELEENFAPVGGAGFGQLTDSFGAEVHLLIQSHGHYLIGEVDEQISKPEVFCNGVTCGTQFAVAFPAVD